MRRYVCVPAVLAAGIGSVSLPSRAAAGGEDFQILWHAVDVDQIADTAAFTLTFSRAPVFALDEAPRDAFQYEIDADVDHVDRPLDFAAIDTIVRGAEIRSGADAIPIRDRDGEGGAGSGGWGPIRAMLPFELDGRTLTFTAPLRAIGDDDGRFRYRLISLKDGSLTGETWSAAVPLPAAAWPGVVMLSALAATRALRSIRR